MGTKVTNGITDNAQFGMVMGDESESVMEFKAHEGTQCQANVVTLSNLKAKLSPLDASELLEGTVIFFNAPGAVGIGLARRLRQVKKVSRPMLRIAVWVKPPHERKRSRGTPVNRPKHPDQAVTSQMDF